MDKGFVGTIIGGIAFIAIAYALINNATGLQTIARGASQEYARLPKTFAGQ